MQIASQIAKYLASVILVLFSAWAAADESNIGIELKALDELLANSADEIIFIDVRDPVEIMFTGFTDAVDLNIPFRLVDRSRWNEKKGVFMMNLNPEFTKQVSALLETKGLNKDSVIVTMCRSGSARGKPSAEYLRKQGFTNARYLVNGFQGDASKEGKFKGLRVTNGWQNSGMDWQKKPNPLKIYKN